MTHSSDHAERAMEVLERAVGFMRHSQLCGVIGGYDCCTCGMEEARDAALRGRDQVVEEERQARECQSVWRCAVGDFTGALDVLKNRWEKSRRKHDREAGATLAGVLNLVWAARDPAAGSYAEAAANGKKLVERVRAALDDTVREGKG